MSTMLTSRERQVLNLTGQGLASAQIAAALGISELTIRKHRSSIIRKAGLRSSAHLVAFASGTTGPEAGIAPLPWDLLRPREAEVVRHVVAGRTSKEIARLLDISPLTVRKHRERAREKLGVRSVGELIRRGSSPAA